MNAYTLPSRWVLFVGALLTFLVLGAGLALACTVYFGTTTIENLTTGEGPYSVVADPSSGMDRCDGAGSGSVFSALNDNGSDDDGDGTVDGDVIRVEIDKYSGSGCGTSGEGDDDSTSGNEHSLAPSESSVSDKDVYVNVQDGYSYYDDDNDDVYEDTDDSSSGSGGNEVAYESSSERDYDCMGDGSGLLSDEINHAGPINVADYGTGEGGQFDSSDSEVLKDNGDGTGDSGVDQDDVNEVQFPIDPNVNDDADSGNGYAAAVCVSHDDGGESAPQIPLVIDSP